MKRPTSAKEAKALARQGDAALAVLGYEQKLKAKEVTNSLKALGLIGTEAAYQTLLTWKAQKKTSGVTRALLALADTFAPERLGPDLLETGLRLRFRFRTHGCTPGASTAFD